MTDVVFGTIVVTLPDETTLTFPPNAGPPVPGPGMPEAPEDGIGYVRRDGAWAPEGTGSAGGYPFTQSSASAVWTINHNLGYRPSCTLRDAGGNVYEADISHPTTTQTVVTHSAPVTGSAWLI